MEIDVCPVCGANLFHTTIHASVLSVAIVERRFVRRPASNLVGA